MEEIKINLQVLFENPFWIGVFERIYKDKISVAKVTFGAEPKEYDIESYVLRNYYKLNFSSEIALKKEINRKINPKRMQKQIKKQVSNVSIGTKSQQALKLQHEQMKTERKARKKEFSEFEKKRLFQMKQQKKKEKHKGR